MMIMKRWGTALLLVLGLGLVAGGGGLLWADARLDDAPRQSAEVVLSGPRVTDVDVPVAGSDRIRTYQPLTGDDPLPIGSQIDVQAIREPVTVARLAGDQRFGTWGAAIAGAGLATLVVFAVVVVRARRRSTGASAGSATPAAALVTLLLLSGCSWSGDSVDRDAYRTARSALTTAFPAALSDTPEPVFGTFLSDPISDPEAAVPVILAAAGVPQDPSTTTAARFVARQMFDPAFLCDSATAEPLLAMLHPDIAAQAAAVANEAGIFVRLTDCAGLDRSGLRLGLATGSVTPGLGAGYPGTTVILRVASVFAAAAAGDAPFAVEREWTLGIPAEDAGQIATIGWKGLDAGAGISTVALPDSDLPSWDTDLLPPPVEPDAEAAAAVIEALAATMATDTVAIGLRQETLTDEKEPELLTGSGAMVPDGGLAQMTFDHPDFREVRVLDQRRQFGDYPGSPDPDNGGTWYLYDTGLTPRLAEGSTTHNPYAPLDWLRSLSAAAPVTCPDGVVAERCFAVTVPTVETLTPGTPGYREATVNARRGNSSMTLLVGESDEKLAAVVVSRSHGRSGGPAARVTSTWTFGSWEGAPPVIERPLFWSDSGA